ncbi:MAG: MopE-related protein, partial [Myxococcota bacterium]
DDTTVDTATLSSFYADADGDGYGTGGAVYACDAPAGHAATAGDCDDARGWVSPGVAAEDCATTYDDDCDGISNETDAAGCTAFYADADLDGYGAATSSCLCSATAAFPASGATDCDDAAASVNPSATEACDGVDDDCDGDVDEGGSTGETTWYLDGDGDGYGESGSTVSACESPSGYASTPGDCEDGDNAVNPAATEVCNDGVDNDCSGEAVACRPSGSNPSNYVAWRGVTSGDWSSWSVDGAGDVDGDGDGEFVVGAYGEDSAGSGAGAVYLVSGPADSGGVLSSATMTVLGESASDHLGYAVAGGADLTGDSVLDILVGGSAWSFGGAEVGAAAVFSADASGSVSATAAEATLIGAAFDDAAGASVDVGDLDGDSAWDAIMGATGPDHAGSGSGAVYVFLGPLSGDIDASGADVRLTGESTYAAAGYSVASGGDVDGDGLADLVVGAIGDTSLGPGSGAAYLCLGASLATGSLADADGVFRADRGATVGISVAMSGDADGDGLADVLIAAEDANNGGRGRAFLFHDGFTGAVDDGDADAAFTSPVSNGYLYDLDWIGDFDGDGSDDFALGVMGADYNGTESGAVYLFYSPVSGSLTSADADAYWYGSSADDRLGTTVSGLGDIDGDGYPDFAMGSFYRDGSRGETLVAFGGGL